MACSVPSHNEAEHTKYPENHPTCRGAGVSSPVSSHSSSRHRDTTAATAPRRLQPRPAPAPAENLSKPVKPAGHKMRRLEAKLNDTDFHVMRIRVGHGGCSFISLRRVSALFCVAKLFFFPVLRSLCISLHRRDAEHLLALRCVGREGQMRQLSQEMYVFCDCLAMCICFFWMS